MSTFQEQLKAMEEKYGSVKTDSDNSTGSSAINSTKDNASSRFQSLLSEMDKKYGSSGSAVNVKGTTNSRGAVNKTSQQFYSRPEFDSMETLYNAVKEQEAVFQEKRTSLETAQSLADEISSSLTFWESQVQLLQSSYEADPSENIENYFNKAYSQYERLLNDYNNAYSSYRAAYDEYKPIEEQYNAAVSAYNQQWSAFDDWRSTIREAAAVKQELDQLDGEIQALETEIGSLKTLTNFRNDALGVQMKQSLQDAQTKLEALRSSRQLLQEEYDWSRYYQYADLMDAKDFKEKSRYVSTANGQEAVLDKLRGTYTETGFNDLTYDYINQNEDARGKALVNSIGDNTALLGLDTSYLKEMTEDEISIFNYLYATQGADAAYQYTAYLTGNLTQRQRMEQEASWADWAEEHPVKSSVFSTMISLIKGLSYLGQLADKSADGEIDQNAAYNKFSYTNSAIRNQVSKQIEESGKWGKVGSFAYQTGMSMADFLLNTAITGGNQTLSLAIMGTGAAADTTIAAKDRGLSDDQAFILGTVAGLAEVITEKVSLEALLNPRMLKDGTLKYVLKNMLAEGGEEAGSDLINLFADILISGDQSEWQQSINAYKKDGRTEKEAFLLAFKDQALTVGLDMLGGAISGGIMAGTGAVVYNSNTKKLGNELADLQLSNEDIQMFIETGLESDPETDAYQIAAELQTKIQKGQELSNSDLSRLYQANVQAVAEEQENQGDQELTGLQLPTVEEAAQNQREAAVSPVGVTHNAENVPLSTRNATGNQDNGTAAAAQAPLSVAERMRQEQMNHGGNTYEDDTGLRLGAAFGNTGTGDYISDGGSQWNAGTGSGKQAGGLAGSAEKSGNAYSDRSRATVARQNYARSLRLEKVSSLDLGLQNGTEARNIQVMPREYWDSDMSELAERIYNETGKNVTYVMGRIQIRGSEGISYARGVNTADGIIVQADHLRVSMEQIADHEAYHAKVDFAGGRLNDEIRHHIIETFSAEQFQQVLDKYIVGMRGVIDVAEAKTGEEFADAVRRVEEEIFADAYAGINAFGANADRFTDAVNEKMDQLSMGKLRKQENGTEKPTGPPAERYSYAGENAETANLQTLGENHEGKNPRERFSVDEVDSHGHSLTPEQQEFYEQSQARDSSGRLLVLYHQTDGDFTIFDTRHPGAGSRDSGTPFGIFLKRSAGDIGLAGKKQMALYANITNPLRAENREDLDRQLREISGSYAAISDKHKQLDAQYHEKLEQAEKAWRDYIIEWRAANPGANSSALNDDPKFNELFDAEDTVVDEWTAAADLLSTQAKEAITQDLRAAGYDGVFLENDVGSWGRRTDAIIALDPQQVKNISNKTPTSNPDIRHSVDDGGQDPAQQQPAAPKKKIRPVAESRPLIAKRDLRNTMFNLFSVPGERRVELGTMIDSYADRLIKNGSLTEEDRKAFFDRMYDSDVMTVPADEYFANTRSLVHGGRVYVSDHIRSEFGDDWNDIRRRAFGAGIYLTSDRSAGGIDMWNHELSGILPGLFDSEETDMRSILERIVQVAEEGKDEKMSLAEYTARLAEIEHQSEDEFLDNMERQMDWALRTFAEKAKLEVHLRDRTGTKIAQEREKGTERLTRQKARESQRRAEERQERKEMAKRQRDRKELRELQQKTLKQLQWLNKNRNRAPEELKATWDEVLGDIDLYAVSAANEMNWSDKYNATWKDLAQMYKDAMKNDPNFLPSKELERIVTRLDGTKIADMDLGALQDLYKAAIGLRTEFYNRNNVINDEMHRLFAEVYTDAKREIEAAPGGYTGKATDKFLNLEQLTPMNVLQRMGGWDPDGTFYSMAKQLERGERDIRAYTVKANRMLQDFLTEHEDWVKIADGQGKDAIWYEVEVPQLLELGMGDKPIFGPTVKVYMTPAQKVHMFLESKNLDNLRHMTGGRTFVDKELYSQGKRQEALSQGRTIKLAPETVRKLVSDLTAEEMELARILDHYYNTFATQEINKISNILYGYDKAMGKNYAPIYTNRNYTKAEFGVFDTTAEGVGNLKGRQYAVNPSYNISAFDAFERHVDQTARFCGMAIPARNWTTLMNWREKNNSTGDVITHKWGEESKRYISDLITTLQGGDESKSESVSSGLSKLQSNYITAVFGANPSIVLKQLGSVPLASAYLDARNVPSAAQIRSIDRSLISKYTQDLEWRTMGYSMPETKFLKDNPNWTQSNKFFGFVFGGDAITAMDGWAASVLWPWAENKVRRENPKLEIGTKAQVEAGESPFYKKVAEEFENAVARSQSTSDEIHQSLLRKSKNPLTKAFTMFRSDSAQTYNTIRQKIGEAQFAARSGATGTAVKAAKRAAGAAFMAMLLNAVWSEGISFLMALWKNKGKYYRDDEDELTFGSVAGEMVNNMIGSIAGTVTFGDELAELIGSILVGDDWYDIEVSGMEQLNDIIKVVYETLVGMQEIISGAVDIQKNDGDVGRYLDNNSGAILGHIKNVAESAATYLPGLPVKNVEAYLIGALKWISPKLGTAYDDLFSDVGKSDLTGMKGSALESRISRILSDRKISESDDTTETLAALYEAGYKTAIPSDTPTSISIDGEVHSLGAYQQQTYDNIWGAIVSNALDDMVSSDSFTGLDQENQAKMLRNLYSYAAEQAKAELFDEYEMDSGAAKNAEIVAAGATVAECIAWNTITSGMKSSEKSAELVNWDIPDKAKQAIFRNKISDSREDSIAVFEEAGLSFDQFLQAYSKYGEINNEDLDAGMKATEFSRWVNNQNYTSEQAAIVKDELTYFNMTPATAGRYDELVDAGMDSDAAYDLTSVLNELQPEEGEDQVSNLQKWRASVDFSDDVEDQLTALFAVMTDAQFQKVEIANDFGVSPDAYVTFQETKSKYDSDGNGSYSNAEIEAAINGMTGYFTTEQKAVLWQLGTGSTSAKNNPYSKTVGQKVIDARAAAKEATEQSASKTTSKSEEDSFSQEILKQLLGRG